MATGYYKRNFEQQQQGYDTVQLQTNGWCCTKYDWNDDNMRRHTEAEASVLFGKSRNPFSPSTPAPLSKGGVLYGSKYLDEVRWQSNQGKRQKDEDDADKTPDRREQQNTICTHAILTTRDISQVTDKWHHSIYGVWSETIRLNSTRPQKWKKKM